MALKIGMAHQFHGNFHFSGSGPFQVRGVENPHLLAKWVVWTAMQRKVYPLPQSPRISPVIFLRNSSLLSSLPIWCLSSLEQALGNILFQPLLTHIYNFIHFFEIIKQSQSFKWSFHRFKKNLFEAVKASNVFLWNCQVSKLKNNEFLLPLQNLDV